MFFEIQIFDQFLLYDIDELARKYSSIKIGRLTDDVWNTIAIDDDSVDPFQCHLIGCEGGPWRLNNGQNRTDCPKGLKSDKMIPCNSCEGPCVGGRPKYTNRYPSEATLINGQPVSEWGTVINVGDKITFGNVEIRII